MSTSLKASPGVENIRDGMYRVVGPRIPVFIKRVGTGTSEHSVCLGEKIARDLSAPAGGS